MLESNIHRVTESISDINCEEIRATIIVFCYNIFTPPVGGVRELFATMLISLLTPTTTSHMRAIT